MVVRVIPPERADELLEFLRRAKFLAVKRRDEAIWANPLSPISPRYDQLEVRAYVELWQTSHPDVGVEVLAA
jgi:hypothetical protein